jgi:hypothetical protein
MAKFSGQTLVVLIFLVVTPAISMLVLFTGRKSGIEFYKDLKQNLGTVQWAEANDLTNTKNSTEQYKGKVIVFSNFAKESFDTLASVFKIVNKIDQFKDEIDNLEFIGLYDSTAQNEVRQFYGSFLQSDKDRWHFLNAAPKDFNLNPPTSFNVAIVDTVGAIRRYYDLKLETEKKKFVENLSVMPNKKKVGNVVKKEQKNY